jgi:hypothetical protein
MEIGERPLLKELAEPVEELRMNTNMALTVVLHETGKEENKRRDTTTKKEAEKWKKEELCSWEKLPKERHGLT